MRRSRHAAWTAAALIAAVGVGIAVCVLSGFRNARLGTPVTFEAIEGAFGGLELGSVRKEEKGISIPLRWFIRTPEAAQPGRIVYRVVGRVAGADIEIRAEGGVFLKGMRMPERTEVIDNVPSGTYKVYYISPSGERKYLQDVLVPVDP